MRKILQTSLAMLLVTAFLFGCGGGTTAEDGGDDASDDAGGDGSDSDGGSDSSSSEVDNALASTYPVGLAVTSVAPTTTESALRAGLTLKNAAEISEEEAEIQDYETAVQEQVDLLNGETAADCQIDMGFRQKRTSTCFGNGFNITLNGQSVQAVLFGDGGIESATEEDGTPCPVAKLNSQISYIGQLLTMSNNIAASGLCAAKVEAVAEEPPAAGEEPIDIAEAMNTVNDENGTPLNITEATIATEPEETTEGEVVNITTIAGEIEGLAANNANFSEDPSFELSIEHIHADEETPTGLIKKIAIGDEDYRGRMTFKVYFPISGDVGPFAPPTTCGDDGMTQCTVVDYEKTPGTEEGSYTLNALVQSAMYCGSLETVNCLNADNSLNTDPGAAQENLGGNPPPGGGNPPPGGGNPPPGGTLVLKGQESEELTDWEKDFNYLHVMVDVSNNGETVTGNTTFAWQAGDQDGSSRVLIIDADENGGCGYAGFGPGYKAESEQAIDGTLSGFCGYWQNNYINGVTNALGTDPDQRFANGGPCSQRVQRECYTANADGSYSVDESNLAIQWAPTVDLNTTAQQQMGFTSSTLDGGWTATAGQVFTTNMPLLSEVSGDLPTFTAPDVSSE